MSFQTSFNQTISNLYFSFSEQIPVKYKPLIVLALYTLIIAIYAIFIWKFYKFLAKRNILELNLSQYNRTEHPSWSKFTATLLFLVEYVIIVPILVFFWFGTLALFLLLLSKSQDVSQILLVAAAIIAATRMTAYYSQDLSKDLAKMFPFTVLAVILLEPQFFSVEKLIARFSAIPSFIGHIFSFLIFIAIIEVIMRVLFTLIDFSWSKQEEVV